MRRSPAVAVGLAVALLALPLTTAPTPVYRGLTFSGVEVVVLTGIVVGWLVTDRLAAATIAPPIIATLVVAAAVGGVIAAETVVFAGPGPGRNLARVLAPAFVGGAFVRGTLPAGRGPASLVAMAAVTSWLTYDVVAIPKDPLRDLHLYLNAALDWSAGASPYLDAPLSSIPATDQLPFVYPPFTLPLFELLARLPLLAVEIGWLAASVGAVVGGMWLLGVRGRWLLALMAWPPLALGLAVGNVAMFSFLLLCLGFRVGAALVLGGAFKLQSAIPSLWLVRERRYRSLAIGLGLLAVACLVTLPLVGWQAWLDWARALGYFQATTDAFPSMRGFSLTRWFVPAVLVAVTVLGVGLAFLGRGRNGLARFGVASVVASPTLYQHGLAPILPATLPLRVDLLWFTLGLGPWIGAGISAWLAIVIVSVGLLTARGADLEVEGGEDEAGRDLHPAGRATRVWPDAGG